MRVHPLPHFALMHGFLHRVGTRPVVPPGLGFTNMVFVHTWYGPASKTLVNLELVQILSSGLVIGSLFGSV